MIRDVLGLVFRVDFVCNDKLLLSTVSVFLFLIFGVANWTSVVIWTGLTMLFCGSEI